MMWQAVVQLAPYLSSEYRKVFSDFRQVVTGGTGETNIWQKCITEMSHYDNEIGDPLGVIFLDEKFDKKDKDSVSSYSKVIIWGCYGTLFWEPAVTHLRRVLRIEARLLVINF